MIAPERRVIVEVPSYGEVMEKVKGDVLRLLAEKVMEFQENQFVIRFGKPWQRERDTKGVILCPQYGESRGFERTLAEATT